jgi:hypothetical protein
MSFLRQNKLSLLAAAFLIGGVAGIAFYALKKPAVQIPLKHVSKPPELKLLKMWGKSKDEFTYNIGVRLREAPNHDKKTDFCGTRPGCRIFHYINHSFCWSEEISLTTNPEGNDIDFIVYRFFNLFQPRCGYRTGNLATVEELIGSVGPYDPPDLIVRTEPKSYGVEATGYWDNPPYRVVMYGVCSPMEKKNGKWQFWPFRHCTMVGYWKADCRTESAGCPTLEAIKKVQGNFVHVF